MSAPMQPGPADAVEAPAFVPTLTLTVVACPSGLLFVTSDAYRGMMAAGRTLANVLEQVPQAFADLLAAGAVIPALDGLTLPEPTPASAQVQP